MRFSVLTIPLTLLICGTAGAATIPVDGSNCTMVDAVEAANTDTAVGGCAAGSGPDTIRLLTDVSLTVPHNGSSQIANGLPLITTEVTVEGGGFEIARGGAVPFRLFKVPSGGSLTLVDLEVRGGGATDTFGVGGAIELRQFASLTVDRCTFEDNAGSIGGAIYAHAASTLRVSDSAFAHNFGWSNAGAIRADGDTVIERSVIHTNGSGPNGAGGIGIGGGEFGDFRMVNTTVSGNTTAGRGGGIRVFNDQPVSIELSTLWGNTADQAGDGLYASFVSVTIGSSIVAGGDPNCELFDAAIVDAGSNLGDDASCGAGFTTLTGFDTRLADNGGGTLTHRLLGGSSAIDAAGACGSATDQRGVPRDDTGCDSGAFELSTAVPASSPVARFALLVALLGALLVATGSASVFATRGKAGAPRP